MSQEEQKKFSRQKTLKGSVPDQEDNMKHKSVAHSEQCRPFSIAGVCKN